MRTRSPPAEPSVQVLDISQDGETTAGGGPEPRAPASLVVGVLVALAAGLLYGYFLGRGDRPADEAEPAVTTSTTAPTATTLTSVTVGTLDEHPVGFRRSVPGHDLGRGVMEYLNPNLFSTIAIDGGGLVWAGGPTGVVRLNPDTGGFDRLTDSDGTGPLDVHDLAIGPDGSVYAATERGLSHWDGFEWAPDSKLNQQASEWGMLTPEVGPLAVGPDGSVWLVSHDWSDWSGTSYLHHDSAPLYGDVPTIELPGYISALAIAPDGTVWAQADEGIWRYDGEWTRTSVLGWASAIAVDQDGTAWVGRGAEIIRIEGGDGAATHVFSWVEALDEDWAERIDDGSIRVIAIGPDGTVWALAALWGYWGENERALLKLENGAISSVPLPANSSDLWIRDMAVAPNGDPWVATHGRLMRYNGAGWENFFVADQPPIGSIGSMAVGPDGDLWVAGDGQVSRLASDGWVVLDRTHIWALGVAEGEAWVASGGDRVWVGIGCRVFEYTTSGWETLPPLPGEIRDCWNPATVAQSDGSLWLATWGSWESTTDVYHWTGDEWTAVGRAGFEASGLDVGSDGTPWLTGWEGIGRLEEGEWVPVVTGQEFDQLVVADDGTVWASTQDLRSSGLWRFDDGVWEIERHEPLDTATLAFARHPNGSIWTLRRGGDGAIDVVGSEGGHHVVVEFGNLHTMTIGPDGAIWVAGEGRLYRVAPPGELTVTVADWGISVDEVGPGTHTVRMTLEIRGLEPDQIGDLSGMLSWSGTGVELCGIGLRNDGDDVLVVGDIFQTTEGCGDNPTAMQDAFHEHGFPEEACVAIEVIGQTRPLSRCGPLEPSGAATP